MPGKRDRGDTESGESRRLAVWALGGLVGLAALLAGAALHAAPDDFEEEAIRYVQTAPQDVISRLQQQLDKGQATLTFDAKSGYLASVLRLLKVPASSQMLVFSKTSLQRDYISPQTPRALYFNDRVYVGFVQGGHLEIATVDPQLGAVFYILDNQHKSAKPTFTRQTYECLQCHSSGMTGGVPGHIMRSVFARPDGLPELRNGSYVTTDQSPFKERWGGWYVTGTHGKQRHMGNVCARGEAGEINEEAGANITDLRRLVDTTPYLTRHSDIVALMVIEHQGRVQNLITKANYQTRMALQYEQILNKELGRPADYRAESTLSRIKSVCEPLAKAMLFVGETTLTAPVTGTSGFSVEFAKPGPHDKLNRSLRDLDLKRRLFRYPCSYLIYSDAFDGLPALAKDYVYRRLKEVLTGQEKSDDFAHLTDLDRKAILDILTDTKPDFAAWMAKHSGA